MTTQYTLVQLADLITELVDARQHTERHPAGWTKSRHRIWATWTTSHPGLLQQLTDTYDRHHGDDQNTSSGSGFGPRPPLSVDALSLRIEIAGDINRWHRQLHLPYVRGAESQARALIGAAGRLDPDDLDELLTNARSWVRRAAVITGWETPAFQPRVECMADGCDSLSGLRLHADTNTGMCVRCGTTWTDADGGFTRLVEHVRIQAISIEAHEKRSTPIAS